MVLHRLPYFSHALPNFLRGFIFPSLERNSPNRTVYKVLNVTSKVFCFAQGVVVEVFCTSHFWDICALLCYIVPTHR